MPTLFLSVNLWLALPLVGSLGVEAVERCAELLGDKVTVAAVHRSTSEWRLVLGTLNIQYYDPDPSRRMQELLKVSKELQEMEEEWNRVWGGDQPLRGPTKRVPKGK